MWTQALGADWLVFAAVIVGVSILESAIFGRSDHRIEFREAALRSVLWVSVGIGFTAWVWSRPSLGGTLAAEYLEAFLIEKSLSVDNLFVFIVLFGAFKIPNEYQHRVLFWGILGALVMRALFIGAGTALLHAFTWTFYIFGAFLIYSGLKLLYERLRPSSDDDDSPAESALVRWIRARLPTTKTIEGHDFFVRRDGRLLATPLFVALVAIEASDVVFAVDSVPAVLAISRDVFVVYTSNIFAIMGLRSLYFVLAGMMGRFHLLDVALAGILSFVGVKMILHEFDIDIPKAVSLSVIALSLTAATIASLVWPPPAEQDEDEAPDPGVRASNPGR